MGVLMPRTDKQADSASAPVTQAVLNERTITGGDRAFIVLVAGIILLASVAAIAYFYLALDFQRGVFAGFMLDDGMEVQDVQSYAEDEWGGLETGLQPGDVITGYAGYRNGILYTRQFEDINPDEPRQAFEDYLENFSVGDEISLYADRRGEESFGENLCIASGQEGVRRCKVTYTLQSFPESDFLGHFAIGYVAGLLALFASVFIMLRRYDSRQARFLSATAAGIAVLIMGRFDLMVGQSELLTLLWIFSGCMVGGSIISFAMVFPDEILYVKRAPILRYAPQLIGIILFAVVYAVYEQEFNFALGLPMFFLITGTTTMVSIMVWRRQYSSSPILREQASYVLLGSVFVLAWMVVWLGFALFYDATPEWLFPVLQVSTLIFIFNSAYATLQHRLLETDRLVPVTLVYAIMSAVLVLGYFMVVTALSFIGVNTLDNNNPFLVAGTVLVVTLGFVPLRNYLRSRVDEVMFRRRRMYQTIIENLVRRLTNALNLNDVETAIRQTLNDTLVPNVIILFVRDSEAQVFRPHRLPGAEQTVTDVTFDYKSGLVRYLQNESSMLYIERGKLPPPMVYPDRGKLSLLNAPILVRLKGQRQLSGFLAIGTRRSNDNYTYEDLRFIENVADQAALALERSQIVEDLEHQLVVQNVLSQLSRALNFAIDFDILLELIYAQTARVIDADVFAIGIVDASINEMYYAFYSEGDDRLAIIEGKRWKLGRDLMSEIARTQKVIRTDDYRHEVHRRDANAEIENPNIKAWMAVPMTADRVQGSLGVMAVGSTDPLVLYNEEQEQILSDIANIAASAIDKTRLFQATQARTQQLEALNEISGKLSYEIEDVNRLLELVTQSATEILESEAGSLLLVDNETGDLIFQVAVGPSGHELVGMRIPMEGSSLAAEAVKRSETIIVNDTSTDSRWHGEVVNDEEVEEDDTLAEAFRSRAILTTPLLTKGNAIGVLQVINKRDGSPFNDEDGTLLTTFAAQAAVAIENARLFGQTDEQLNLRLEELNLMTEIDKSLNRTLEMNRVAEITLNWALRETGATAGAVAVVREGYDELILLTSRGYPEKSLLYLNEEKEVQSISSKEGIWGRVIETRRLSFARNLENDLAYIETLPGAKVQTIVPMMSADEVIGILIAESRIEGTLTLINAQFLERLADSASAAITNARLFGKLEEEQKRRVDFVSFIAHELKNPMTSMKGYTDLLLKGIVGPVNEQQTDFLSTIFNNVERLQTLVSDLNDVTKLGADRFPMEMSSVDFRQVYLESLRSVQQAFDRKNQAVISEVGEELPLVWGDQKRLVQVMVNFLTNANKYTPAEGDVTIRAEVALNIWDKEGARRVLHIQIVDTGIGISEEDLPRLFREQYFRTENAKATDEPGTGLGMVLTRGLILQHGGQVWVESTLGKGTTFHFTLPLAEEILTESI